VYGMSIYGSNLYFVRSGASWVLIDTGWAWGGCARIIQEAAEALFGPDIPPAAILLTPVHRDHDGAALEPARGWGARCMFIPTSCR
jgi:glyoxylase-like metal-dependent hydrolase (beta-lactamase superfamily II)